MPRLDRSGRWIHFAWLCVLISLWGGCGSPASDRPSVQDAVAEQTVYDRWYREEVNGQMLGHSRHTVAVLDGQRVTTYQEHLVESHGGERMETRLTTTWTETADHRPVTYRVREQAGGEKLVQVYRFYPDRIELTSEQAGRSTVNQIDLPSGQWLTPGAFEAALKDAIKKGDSTITLQTWDPTLSASVYTVSYTRVADDGGIVASTPGQTAWDVTYSYIPGIRVREVYDADAVLLSYRVKIDEGLVYRGSLADRSIAGLTFNPPEMGGRSLVTPDRPIEQMNTVRRAVYELKYETRTDFWPTNLPPKLARQSVERIDDQTVRVVVDLEAAGGNPFDMPIENNLEASTMVDHRDPAVRQLVEKLVNQLGGEPTSSQFAQAAERFVFRHMSDATLSVGNGSASETARSGAGDCTEASVLLAAMLRARGIPSRCVIGLCYSEERFLGQSDVFVFHQWTQAWITDNRGKNGRWVDLDAAVLGYRAGHIALGTSDMGHDAQAQTIKLFPLMTGLSIRVVEITR